MNHPLRTNKPWGFEELWHCERYAIKRLHLLAGCRLSLQYHEHKTETLIVHRGCVRVLIGSQSHIYMPGDVIHIAAGVVHRIAAHTREDVDLFEASTPELDDVVRLEDDYGRVESRHIRLIPGARSQDHGPDGARLPKRQT